MKSREIVFCPKCGYIVDRAPTFRLIGWYRITYSFCPFCGTFGYLRIGKVDIGYTSNFIKVLN